jgi:2-(1,2-epoxy-1,2-dihydrophenyl)acetyl-CoA isomerase
MSIYAELIERGESGGQEAVLVERLSPDRAVVRMNEPDRLNALSAAMCVGLNRALDDLEADEELRTIVLTGNGSAFSAGGDMEMMRMGAHRIGEEAGNTDVWRWIRGQFGGVVRRIARSDKTVLAAVNGPAAGVGLAFALTCDLVIASERARLVPAFGRIGLLPEVGTSWALTRRLGYQGAFAFFAGGRHMGAEEAQRLGLVAEVVDHDELMPAAERWAERIARLPAHAIPMGKPLLRRAADLSWEESVTMEEFAEPNCFTTAAFRQAVESFGADGPREGSVDG